MNAEQIRQSLRTKWLEYYRDNRSWLVRLGVWINSEGHRRPSSGFILATLSILEPQLTQLLPLVVDLTSNPDRIISALGLNFSPDEELEKLAKQEEEDIKLLPGQTVDVAFSASRNSEGNAPPVSRLDEACEGIRSNSAVRRRD